MKKRTLFVGLILLATLAFAQEGPNSVTFESAAPVESRLAIPPR